RHSPPWPFPPRPWMGRVLPLRQSVSSMPVLPSLLHSAATWAGPCPLSPWENAPLLVEGEGGCSGRVRVRGTRRTGQGCVNQRALGASTSALQCAIREGVGGEGGAEGDEWFGRRRRHQPAPAPARASAGRCLARLRRLHPPEPNDRGPGRGDDRRPAG